MSRIFSTENVSKIYKNKRGFFDYSKSADTVALDEVSFIVEEGKTLGVVGESGSGKSTLARLLICLEEVTEGEIRYQISKGEMKNLTSFSVEERKIFKREVQMVFQDPYRSLNPMKRIIDSMDLALHRYEPNKRERYRNIVEQMERVQLTESQLFKYPHELSGGQKQRINIARVLSLRPRVIIFDEATSSLDVSVQASVINLIKDLQQDLGLTYIFISHDLSVVDYVSDSILVLYRGKIVEKIADGNLVSTAEHEYTKRLLKAIPLID